MSTRKNQIIDTAEVLFARYGYDGTTTRLISETANANIAMISYYFGGKAMLLKAILDRLADDISVLVNRVQSEENDPRERLKCWVFNYIDYVFTHPNPIIIAHRQFNIITDNPEIFGPSKEAFDKIRFQIYETLEEGQNLGLFKKIDTELTLITLKATVEDLVLQNQMIKQDLNINGMQDSLELYPEVFKNRVKKHMLSILEIFLFESEG